MQKHNKFMFHVFKVTIIYLNQRVKHSYIISILIFQEEQQSSFWKECYEAKNKLRLIP